MRQPLFAFLGIRCGVPPRQTHEINAVRWPQVADCKNSPNRGIRRGQLLTSQTAFGVQLPYKGSLVRSVARFHHIPLSIMAGFYEPRASVMASAIHTSRGGTPFGRPLRYRIQAIKFYVAVCRICRGCPSGAARQRDFITSHPGIMAGFYEPRTTNHEPLFLLRAEGYSRRCRQFESVAAQRHLNPRRPATCELRPAGPSAPKFDERLFARPIGPNLH